MSNKSLLKSLDLDEFVALDIETTGLDSSSESIIELSAVRFKDGIQVDIFTHLLDPGKTISPLLKILQEYLILWSKESQFSLIY